MGYASTYASYLVITVVDGAAKSQRAMAAVDFEAFRRRQFARFKKTPEYAEEIARLQEHEEPRLEKEFEEFLFEAATGVYVTRIFESSPESDDE